MVDIDFWYLTNVIYSCIIPIKNLKGDGLMAGVKSDLLCGDHSMLVFSGICNGSLL